MAPAEPPDRQPTAADGTVDPDRLERVRAARRVKPAARSEQRADEPAVTGNQPDEQPRRRRPPRHRCSGARSKSHTAPPCRRSSDRITSPSSAAKSAWLAVAACGLARNTRRLPSGSDWRYPTARWRSRRLTLLRTTAGPTARLTVKPILGGSATPSRTSRWPTRSGRPALLPLLIEALNSARRRIRAAAGSMWHLRHPDGSADQTLTRARPLRRRAASTARPARVRMRSRKPCVLARRRLFG